MHFVTRRRLLCVLVIVVLLASACGSDSDSETLVDSSNDNKTGSQSSSADSPAEPTIPPNTESQPASIPGGDAAPFIGRWTWKSDYNSQWYIYEFLPDGSLNMSNPADPNYYTRGTYEVQDSSHIVLIYNESSDYLSAPGYRNVFEYRFEQREVEYEGQTAARDVFVMKGPNNSDLVFIKLD